MFAAPDTRTLTGTELAVHNSFKESKVLLTYAFQILTKLYHYGVVPTVAKIYLSAPGYNTLGSKLLNSVFTSTHEGPKGAEAIT